jgi:hypothetical protein
MCTPGHVVLTVKGGRLLVVYLLCHISFLSSTRLKPRRDEEEKLMLSHMNQFGGVIIQELEDNFVNFIWTNRLGVKATSIFMQRTMGTHTDEQRP